jgi:hypothetical protein
MKIWGFRVPQGKTGHRPPWRTQERLCRLDAVFWTGFRATGVELDAAGPNDAVVCS